MDHPKQSGTPALKTDSKRAIKKITEATDDLIGNKIAADKITNVSRKSPQNSSETVEGETENTRFDRGIPKERYIYISTKEDSELLMI